MEYYNIINHSPSNSVSSSTYLPLSIGNEWVYKVSKCDSLEQNCVFDRYDTVKVTGTSLINGDTFYDITSLGYYPLSNQISLDSIFIYNANYDILFCTSSDQNLIIPYKLIDSTGLTEVVIWDAYYHLVEEDFAIYVPAGVFPVVNFQGQFYTEFDNYSHERIVNHYYSKDVGLVKYTFGFLYSNDIFKCELSSYTVN